MADAKKCDRCGLYYIVPAAKDGLVSDVTDAICNFLSPKTQGKKFADCVGEAICDLCPGCRQSLAEWLDKGAKEGMRYGGTPDVCENDN
jgi:hypothetical protein